MKKSYAAVILADAVANVKYIGTGFEGIKSRLVVNTSVPTIRLSEVRFYNVLPLFR